MGVISGLLSMCFWGIALFLAALASRKIGNILTLFWMQCFGFVIGLIYFVFNLQTLSFSQITSVLPVLFLIALLQVIAYLAFYQGAAKGQVSLVSPLGSSWSLITVLLSVIFLHEVLKTSQLLGMFAIIIGIVLLSVNFRELAREKNFKLLSGVKEGIIAMLGWGISLFLLIFASQQLGWFLPAFLFRLLILGILLAYLFVQHKPLLPAEFKQKFPWLILVATGVFDILAFFSYSIGVSGSNGSVVAPISSAYALVTILLSYLFLHEKIGSRQLAGIAVLIMGLVLIAV